MLDAFELRWQRQALGLTFGFGRVGGFARLVGSAVLHPGFFEQRGLRLGVKQLPLQAGFRSKFQSATASSVRA